MLLALFLSLAFLFFEEEIDFLTISVVAVDLEENRADQKVVKHGEQLSIA